MLKQKVIRWILDSEEQGIEKDTIISKLKDTGYPDKIIADLLKGANRKKIIRRFASGTIVFIMVCFVFMISLREIFVNIPKDYPRSNLIIENIPRNGFTLPILIWLKTPESTLNYEYANILLKKGNYLKADYYFNKCLRRNRSKIPEYIIYYKLAETSFLIGNKYNAVKYINKFNERYPFDEGIINRDFMKNSKIVSMLTDTIIQKINIYYIKSGHSRKEIVESAEVILDKASEILLKNSDCIFLNQKYADSSRKMAEEDYLRSAIISEELISICDYYSNATRLYALAIQ